MTLPILNLSTSTNANPGLTLISDTPTGGLAASRIAPNLPKLTPHGQDPNSGPRVGFGAHLPGRALPGTITQAASLEAPKQSLQPRTFVPLNESKLYAVVDGSTLYVFVTCST